MEIQCHSCCYVILTELRANKVFFVLMLCLNLIFMGFSFEKLCSPPTSERESTTFVDLASVVNNQIFFFFLFSVAGVCIRCHEIRRTTWTVTHYMNLDALHGLWRTTWTVTHYMYYDALHELWGTTWTVTHYLNCDALHELRRTTWNVTYYMNCDALHVLWRTTWTVRHYMNCDALLGLWRTTWT